MVLVDAALGVRAVGQPFRAAPLPLRWLLGVRPLRDALVATFLTNPMFTRNLLQLFIDNPERATPDWVRIYQQPLVVQGSTAAIGEWLPALLAPDAPAASEDPGAYRSLGMPLTLIWGERDTITPLAQGQRIAALVPHAELLVMSGVGHIPQIEDGERFDGLLLQVLSRLAGAQPGAPDASSGAFDDAHVALGGDRRPRQLGGKMGSDHILRKCGLTPFPFAFLGKPCPGVEVNLQRRTAGAARRTDRPLDLGQIGSGSRAHTRSTPRTAASWKTQGCWRGRHG